jgi:hypothetical protein
MSTRPRVADQGSSSLRRVPPGAAAKYPAPLIHAKCPGAAAGAAACQQGTHAATQLLAACSSGRQVVQFAACSTSCQCREGCCSIALLLNPGHRAQKLQVQQLVQHLRNPCCSPSMELPQQRQALLSNNRSSSLQGQLTHQSVQLKLGGSPGTFGWRAFQYQCETLMTQQVAADTGTRS